MNLILNIKNILLKENYHLISNNINLRDFHPQLYIFLAATGIFTNNRNSLLRFIWPFVCISIVIIGLVLQGICVVHGVIVKDYTVATECFFYFLLLGVIIAVYGGILSNREKIFKLLDDMDNDFLLIHTMEPKYRDYFLKGQLMIRKLCYAWYIYTSIIAVMNFLLMMGTLLVQSLANTPDSHTNRPLMFPIWLPEDDPYRTPNYEIFAFIETCYLAIVIQSFCGYISVLLHILLHYYYVLDIIIKDFEVLFDGLDETVTHLSPQHPLRMEVQHTLNVRMKRIVQRHNLVFKSVKTVSSVFGPPLVYQVLFSAIGLCLLAFQVADKLEKGQIDIIFIMLFVGCCIQLWIPCYMGTLIRDKGYAVGDACWNSGWHKSRLGVLIRSDMVLVIQRSQRPVTIKFIGLPQLQLETFSSIATTAYSYFNMLRQYNSDS
ncbi:odorant receptor 82a-like [Achroia grisella]|uniref:odorant receptor 82a-like n=1 Tax=Achroia grisella TaxID=688607 RepID=UPI0027D2F585|nr:odorant receptor 82a-like [Achroia grisella]